MYTKKKTKQFSFIDKNIVEPITYSNELIKLYLHRGNPEYVVK